VTVVDGRAGENWLVYAPTPSGGGGSSGSGSGSALSSSGSLHSSSSSGSGSLHSSSSGSGGQPSGGSGAPALAPLYDSASSWWTQTCAGPLHAEVVRAVAAAAGRYMHVMWPEVAHAPGLELTRRLLAGPLGAGWAGRVFFSDDGSTAVEVALKMAFRKFMVDHAMLEAGPPLEARAHRRGMGACH
jgi:hypothetical protein